MKKSVKQDLHYLRMAWLVGQDRSKDPKTKVGSLIVTPDTRQISSGYNGFASGIEETQERWTSPRKHDYVIHAEENAVVNCPFDTKGCWVYVSFQPCHKCLSILRNANVSRLVFCQLYDKINWDIWENVAPLLDEVVHINFDVEASLSKRLDDIKSSDYKYYTVSKNGRYNKSWRKTHERISIYNEQQRQTR